MFCAAPERNRVSRKCVPKRSFGTREIDSRHAPHSTPHALLRLLAWSLVVVLPAAGCRAYQFGDQSLYPSYIQTVYVPVFECSSFRRGLGEWLTEAVEKEIELKTPYKVVGSPDNADSVLSGRITNEGKRMTIPAPTGDTRMGEYHMQVQVRWVDRRGNVLREGVPVPLDPALATVGASVNFVPEMGQSIATAQQQAIEKLARHIVCLMEAPW